MRYENDKEFKKALEAKLGFLISPKIWELLLEILYAYCLHEPYDDGDVEYAVKKIGRLMHIDKKKRD